MRVRGLDQLSDDLRGGAVSIGNFDGVHRGHARIVERLLEVAARVAGPAVVFTFDPHPVRVLRPDDAPAALTWTERKVRLLQQLGVDATVVYPTDEQLLALSPEDFFHRVICDTLNAQAVVEGPNFFFGHQRAGNIELLGQLCDQAGRSLEIVEPELHGGDFISSSRLRKLIAEGAVEAARKMLTEPYRIRGTVARGAGRGNQIGFPTANIEALRTILPGAGVYAGRAEWAERMWPAAINIGPNPTFGEHRLKVEAHLIGFDDRLYGERLEVEFLTRLRGIHTFDSVDTLQQQLMQDVAAVSQVVSEES